jgi:hypothetical protein
MPHKRLLGLSFVVACVALTHLTNGQEAPAIDTPAQDTPTSQPAVIAVSDNEAITSAMNTQVVIEGTVSTAAWSNSGKVMNINFESAEESRLLAVLFVRDRTKFDEAFNGDVAKTLTGARVRITGKLVEYGGKSERDKGRPQIVLSDPTQVTLVNPTP